MENKTLLIIIVIVIVLFMILSNYKYSSKYEGYYDVDQNQKFDIDDYEKIKEQTGLTHGKYTFGQFEYRDFGLFTKPSLKIGEECDISTQCFRGRMCLCNKCALAPRGNKYPNSSDEYYRFSL